MAWNRSVGASLGWEDRDSDDGICPHLFENGKEARRTASDEE